jgi:NTP pyrophosphatase (non-canonical NTP hydrolase)
MSSYADVEMKILQWGEARRIIPNAKTHTQLLKMFSEMGELADAEIKGDRTAMVDAVGDVMVCLIMFCSLHDLNIVSCMYSAYGEIKDRKGTLTPDGTFVKETV